MAATAELEKSPLLQQETSNWSAAEDPLSQWSVSRLKEYLAAIQCCDLPLSQHTAEELRNKVLSLDTQCSRLYGDHTLHTREVLAMCIADARRRDALMSKVQHNEPVKMAQLMVNDVYDALKFVETACANLGSATWLERVRPDWSDGAALARSIFVCINRDDILAMSGCSELCGSSAYSFAVLVTLMRAVKFGDWAPALKMWKISEPPPGCRWFRGIMPEYFWNMSADTLDSLFQPLQLLVVEKSESTSCTICLVEIFAGETARRLKCGHLFHVHCVAEWIEKQWSKGGQLFSNIGAAATVARCPTCRAGTGI